MTSITMGEEVSYDHVKKKNANLAAQKSLIGGI
jgi:hypothetical protein